MTDYTLYCVVCGTKRVRKAGAFYTADVPMCCEKAMIDINTAILACIEQGTTDYTARIFEPGKQLVWFVPQGISIDSNKLMLQQVIRATYPHVVFLDTDAFNASVERLAEKDQ